MSYYCWLLRLLEANPPSLLEPPMDCEWLILFRVLFPRVLAFATCTYELLWRVESLWFTKMVCALASREISSRSCESLPKLKILNHTLTLNTLVPWVLGLKLFPSDLPPAYSGIFHFSSSTSIILQSKIRSKISVFTMGSMLIRAEHFCRPMLMDF